VALQGGELRVFVEREPTQEEFEELQASYGIGYEDDEELVTQLIKRRLELNRSRHSWRLFANDKLGAPTSAPDFYAVIDESKFITGDEHDLSLGEFYSDRPRILSADSIVFTQDSEGLWRQFAGTKPVRIGDENAHYSSPIVTRDGNWVVVTKVDDTERGPSHIVRLNLQTGREFRVNVAPASQLGAVAALPVINKVLVKRSKLEYPYAGVKQKGPDKPEYYLVDPATGVTRLVTGEFGPIQELGNRFLQDAEKPDEFWAAISDEKKNRTQIGRYSLKDFSFKAVTTVPHLLFNSMSMWVDAGQRKVYVVYKGQLLRLPLETRAEK
jgi:hypothetical protein